MFGVSGFVLRILSITTFYYCFVIYIHEGVHIDVMSCEVSNLDFSTLCNVLTLCLF